MGTPISSKNIHFVGSKSSKDNLYQKKDDFKPVDPSTLELEEEISPDKVNEANKFMQAFHSSMKDFMNSRAAAKASLTSNFNQCTQKMKTNPLLLFAELKKINVEAIPPGFKSFSVPKDGYFCELRVKVTLKSSLKLIKALSSKS